MASNRLMYPLIKHNNANCIAIGSRATTEKLSLQIIGKWLSTEFEGGRHLNRIEKIEA